MAEVINTGLEYVFTQKAPENMEVSISFVNADEMRALNNNYRHKDQKTDVLSFPLAETPFLSAGPPVALGDIVICCEAAMAQAEEYGHSYMRELAFLTVHGLLHLLGFDHDAPENEKIMQEAQSRILDKAGIFR